MREVNLFFLTVVKLLELLFLFVIAIGMTLAASQYYGEHQKFTLTPNSVCFDPSKSKFAASSGVDRADYNCFDDGLIYLLACIAIAWFHFFHHNLLVNLRVSCYSNYGCTVCWKPINFLICKLGYGDQLLGCQYCWRDQCFKPVTVIKTLVLAAYFGYVVYLLEQVNESMLAGEKQFDEAPLKIQVLQLTLVAFAGQHALFIFGRIALFLFIQIFCCGCPCIDGNATELANNEEDPFANRIVSMHYEKYTIEQRQLQHGFDRLHRRSLSDFRSNEAFYSHVREVRVQTQLNRSVRHGFVDSFRNGGFSMAKASMKRSIIKSMRMIENDECGMCLEEFVAPCKITVLGCN